MMRHLETTEGTSLVSQQLEEQRSVGGESAMIKPLS